MFKRNKILSVLIGGNLTNNPLDGGRVQRMESLSQSKTSANIQRFLFGTKNKTTRERGPRTVSTTTIHSLIHSHLVLVCVVSHIICPHPIKMVQCYFFHTEVLKIWKHVFLPIVFIATTDGCNPTRCMTVIPTKTHFRFPKVQPFGRALDFI